MSKPSSRSTLYRLIQAGQLAHRALLLPLSERGLEPGDDAILFELGRSGRTETELAAELGLSEAGLTDRLARLTERGLITRQAVGPELAAGVALSERGVRIRNGLADHWAQLEEALMGELKTKQRKKLGDRLKRFVDLLTF
ncbi:helix-turn-helix domain-containing protein [Devosia sp. J2-20]|jgi:DNA-binding MarR family transcriptional regulator|uniref:Winged helix-turn-helix domain-containing protein n=1 Tax=Devosia litorisediminis TaxID=2829817 RepID=A0A942E3U6_9HYPH|nr:MULTISPECIES: helix-turn-helix domain-containing protein [Devosia]MBS3847713.1 winged helix-turn-helix domain-containing protein [Devosia litorisediminis]MCZ4345687.1 helix-turn-helix domain-containing protein [Devosia neptuniae]WDQ99168.1 helix-turn-helix domain-containing protein [Devosia sp. J2-20]|tara:strand:- start:2628 stop:3050 length:423 start_codon:yes stop_codon:yes gene_type:complete